MSIENILFLKGLPDKEFVVFLIGTNNRLDKMGFYLDAFDVVPNKPKKIEQITKALVLRSKFQGNIVSKKAKNLKLCFN